MLFNSIEYGLFLVAVVALYRALPHRGQNVMLLAASYVFYAAWDWRFLSLIAVSTTVDFFAGRNIWRLHESDRPQHGRRWLLLSIGVNLSLLAIFKYFGFFVDSAVSLLGGLGINVSGPTLSIILPVGISFYTFQTLSYTIDIWRQTMQPTKDFLSFALFVAFFPQLVAGPIERASRLLPQIEQPRIVTGQNVASGLYLIAVGLVRKVVIADTAGVIVDRYFANPTQFGAAEMVAAVILYSLQIYGDFAGYSNIARGSAQLLGFELMRNFRHPYFSASVTEFWRRWHISLSTWLRDYLYIPLGGNRGTPSRTHVNLMATMLLGGLWHGASWNFVIWGGLHGLYLMVHRVLRQRGRPALPRAVGAMITVPLVALTWVPFRLADPTAVGEFVRTLASPSSSDLLLIWLPVLVLLTVTLIIDVPQHAHDNEFVWQNRPAVVRGGLVAGAIVLVLLAGGQLSEPFIYFQF